MSIKEKFINFWKTVKGKIITIAGGVVLVGGIVVSGVLAGNAISDAIDEGKLDDLSGEHTKLIDITDDVVDKSTFSDEYGPFSPETVEGIKIDRGETAETSYLTVLTKSNYKNKTKVYLNCKYTATEKTLDLLDEIDELSKEILTEDKIEDIENDDLLKFMELVNEFVEKNQNNCEITQAADVSSNASLSKIVELTQNNAIISETLAPYIVDIFNSESSAKIEAAKKNYANATFTNTVTVHPDREIVENEETGISTYKYRVTMSATYLANTTSIDLIIESKNGNLSPEQILNYAVEYLNIKYTNNDGKDINTIVEDVEAWEQTLGIEVFADRSTENIINTHTSTVYSITNSRVNQYLTSAELESNLEQ